jgi:hypothetical protein
MPTISRSPGQHPQIPRREILAERNCRCHHIPLCPTRTEESRFATSCESRA